jgi:hypothetical protein
MIRRERPPCDRIAGRSLFGRSYSSNQIGLFSSEIDRFQVEEIALNIDRRLVPAFRIADLEQRPDRDGWNGATYIF